MQILPRSQGVTVLYVIGTTKGSLELGGEAGSVRKK